MYNRTINRNSYSRGSSHLDIVVIYIDGRNDRRAHTPLSRVRRDTRLRTGIVTSRLGIILDNVAVANGKIQRVTGAFAAEDPGCAMCTRRRRGAAVPLEPQDSSASITLIAIMTRFYADTRESAASDTIGGRAERLIEKGTCLGSR